MRLAVLSPALPCRKRCNQRLRGDTRAAKLETCSEWCLSCAEPMANQKLTVSERTHPELRANRRAEDVSMRVEVQ